MDNRTTSTIQAGDYEHPKEKSAFYILKKIPVLDKVVGLYLQYLTQFTQMAEVQGDYFRVTEETAPQLYRVYQTALSRLNINEEYPFFVKADFEYNAYTSGGNAPYLVVHSSIVKNMTEKELLFVIGHELGHVKSGHVIYKMMAEQINQLITGIPVAGNLIVSTGLHYALMDWYRMHEYSADRAGAVAAGEVDEGIMSLGKLLGISEKMQNVHFTADMLLQQNTAFEEGNKNIVNKIFSTVQMMNSTHPWTVCRIRELKEWEKSGEFQSLVSEKIRQDNPQ